MDWKELFEQRILERGYDYYRRGKVEIINHSENEINAAVAGNEDYEVELLFSGDDIVSLYCDCPYAANDNNCKHMAAVLYAYDDFHEVSGAAETDTDSLIKNADPELIMRFLKNEMNYDVRMKGRFIRFVNGENGNIDTSTYKSQLTSLIVQYSDESGLINWKNVSPFINEAIELLEECTNYLIEWKRLYDAFEIVSYYYDEIVLTDLDDDGDLNYFHSVCLEILSDIAEAADYNTKRVLFRTSQKKIKINFEYLYELYFKFISNYFNEDRFLEEMLEYSDKVISMKNISDHERQKWTFYHIELMDKLDYSDRAIESFCKRYVNNIEVCEFLTDRYLKNGDTMKAIAALKLSLDLTKGNMYSSELTHIKLKDIYKQLSDKNNYAAELWIILTEFSVIDKNLYNEYRALFEISEWNEKREQLYSAMKYPTMLPEFFIEEGMIDRLADHVFVNKNLYLIEKYESLLKENYSELILEAYTDKLNKSAENTADRLMYKQWAEKLRHMKTIKGGREKVDTIIKNWQKLYCNRWAMMQEINKVADEDTLEYIEK